MVASCCRFLCYFCRISQHNQGALFDHLSYLLENASVGLGKLVSTVPHKPDLHVLDIYISPVWTRAYQSVLTSRDDFLAVQLLLFHRLLASPSMRGATPLDVAAASVMDNNELALALTESNLQKVSPLSVLCLN